MQLKQGATANARTAVATQEEADKKSGGRKINVPYERPGDLSPPQPRPPR